MTTRADLEAIITAPESARLEFKEARNRFDFDELVRYCVALANEGGGRIVLGVTDGLPRRIVGTGAFPETARTEAGLFEQLHHRIPIEEVRYDDARVLVVHVPSRLPGTAWQHRGAYWMRAGDALHPMSDERLRAIHEEAAPDFSAELCTAARMSDIDPQAVALLRKLWQRRTGSKDHVSRSPERLLADAELVVGGRLTYAALILLGTHEALGRHLAQAEIVFEYRMNEEPGPALDRREYRQGFLTSLDPLWAAIDSRNDKQHFQHRLFVWPVPTFNERTVREVVLNAVSHRDYRSPGSVFVRQFLRRLEVVSPGGFPRGVDPTNVLWEQKPRNRRIAEVLGKCGLVERAGQGFDLIYRECITNGKALPDFARTGEHSVWVTLHGEIQDPEFLRFLEELGRERTAALVTEDLVVIDLVHREHPIPGHLVDRVPGLLQQGIIERRGRGRGTRLLLSSRFYQHARGNGPKRVKRGLDREANKMLLLQRLNEGPGAKLDELREMLPELTRDQVQTLLRALKSEGKAAVEGKTSAARWFLTPALKRKFRQSQTQAGRNRRGNH